MMGNFKLQISNLKLIAGLFVALLLIIFIWNVPKKSVLPAITEPAVGESLKIISTKPDPLEKTTILPSQPIEVTFNKAFSLDKLKIRFDPGVDYEVKTASSNSQDQTIIISFKKPLKLGSGYTLFIFPDPTAKEKLELDKEYSFHFKTINYSGV